MKYAQGNLFSAPPGVYLAHACNCMGVWGSGVAVAFKEKFPKSFIEYEAYCKKGADRGDILICSPEAGYQVLCLFTSKGFAAAVDPPELILSSTRTAMSKVPKDAKVHMPLINSGLFRVPWDMTEEILIQSELDLTVWRL